MKKYWKPLGVLVVMITFGAVLVGTPAGAHVASWAHNWTEHIRPRTDARYFTKTQSDGRYYKKTDTVANATHATTADKASQATNANNLGGQPASGYQHSCQTGAVMGRAEISGASASTSNWTTAGVISSRRFVCDPATYGSNVLVKRAATGSYEVVFGDRVRGNQMGLSIPSGPLAQVTSRVAGNIVSASGPWQCAPGSPPPVFVICFQVEVRNISNAAVDGDFTITIG